MTDANKPERKPDRGQFHIDEQRCKGCGLCIEACPPKVIGMSERLNHYGYSTAVYPGAEIVKDNKNDKSADIHMGFGEWELRVKVVNTAAPIARTRSPLFTRKRWAATAMGFPARTMRPWELPRRPRRA
jgi:ferredoxin